MIILLFFSKSFSESSYYDNLQPDFIPGRYDSFSEETAESIYYAALSYVQHLTYKHNVSFVSVTNDELILSDSSDSNQLKDETNISSINKFKPVFNIDLINQKSNPDTTELEASFNSVFDQTNKQNLLQNLPLVQLPIGQENIRNIFPDSLDNKNDENKHFKKPESFDSFLNKETLTDVESDSLSKNLSDRDNELQSLNNTGNFTVEKIEDILEYDKNTKSKTEKFIEMLKLPFRGMVNIFNYKKIRDGPKEQSPTYQSFKDDFDSDLENIMDYNNESQERYPNKLDNIQITENKDKINPNQEHSCSFGKEVGIFSKRKSKRYNIDQVNNEKKEKYKTILNN